MKFIFLGFCSNSEGKTSILQIQTTLSACKLELDAHELQKKKKKTHHVSCLKKAKKKNHQFLLIGLLVWHGKWPWATAHILRVCGSVPQPRQAAVTCRNTIILTLLRYSFFRAHVPVLSPSRRVKKWFWCHYIYLDICIYAQFRLALHLISFKMFLKTLNLRKTCP